MVLVYVIIILACAIIIIIIAKVLMDKTKSVPSFPSVKNPVNNTSSNTTPVNNTSSNTTPTTSNAASGSMSSKDIMKQLGF